MTRNSIIIILILGSVFKIGAQTPADTLTLKAVIDRIIHTYPSVMQANEAIETAKINYAMSKEIYLPNIAGKASYSYIDPISSLDMNGKTIHIQSHNNTSIGLSLNQLIWDFGKSRPGIETNQIQYELAELQKDQLFQSLTLQGIQAYYMTAFARHSILIKEEQLRNFAEMLQQTLLRKESGSATNYDYLNTNAGLQAVKAELISLAAAKEKRYMALGILSDTLITDQTSLSLKFIRKQENRNLDELIEYALTNRMEMQIIQKEIEIAHLQEKTASRSFNPNLSAGVSGGFGNGYEPNIKKLRANISAGATLEVPIYEGNKRKQERALAKAGINKAEATLLLTEKQIRQQVSDSYYSLLASDATIQQLNVRVELTRAAYEQAKVNYNTGSITNLELLTSATNCSNARLSLLQEEISYQLIWYQLLVNIGMNIYLP
ncbi:MAG: TolC family protein [Bacteroidales bacterium]